MTSSDLGIKVGSKEEVVWTAVIKEAKILLEESERNIIIQKGMIELAESKIEAEKALFLKDPSKT